jgi:hypothetical protein
MPKPYTRNVYWSAESDKFVLKFSDGPTHGKWKKILSVFSKSRPRRRRLLCVWRTGMDRTYEGTAGGAVHSLISKCRTLRVRIDNYHGFSSAVVVVRGS